MKKLTIERLFKPITEHDIVSFQSRNNITLPPYLQDFFIHYNGASTKEHRFFNDISYLVTAFIPLIKNEFDTSVEDILPAIRDEEEGIGRSDLIPFGTDPGGRPFYVSIGSKDYGNVYYDLVGLGESQPLRKIANSFEEFINGLQARNE